MNLFKKLTSVVLSGLMLACGISTTNTFATGEENVDALVVGSSEAKNKFSRILFGQEEKFGDWYSSQDDEKNNVNFYMSENNDKETGDLIHNGKGNKLLPNYSFFKVVLAAVDADQDIEIVKSDASKAVDFICDYKPEYTKIIIVYCTDKNKISDNLLLKFINIKKDITNSGYETGWGTSHDKKFSEKSDFLDCYPLYKSYESYFVGGVYDTSEQYDCDKNPTVYATSEQYDCDKNPTVYATSDKYGYDKKTPQSLVRYAIDEHPVISGAIGLAGLGAVAGACYGIYKGAEKIYNKITNKSLPKKSVPNINKKA